MMPISLVPALSLFYFYVSISPYMCVVPNLAVFCSSLTTLIPGMLLMYFMNDFEMVPVAPITLENKFLKNVSVVNMLLIYFFASMKLEKGHKNNFLTLVLKLWYNYDISRNRKILYGTVG